MKEGGLKGAEMEGLFSQVQNALHKIVPDTIDTSLQNPREDQLRLSLAMSCFYFSPFSQKQCRIEYIGLYGATLGTYKSEHLSLGWRHSFLFLPFPKAVARPKMAENITFSGCDK